MKKLKAIVRGRKDGKAIQDQISPATTDLHDDAVEPGPSPPPPPPAVTFPEGIKELHTCEDAVVDVCFVHGLSGNREETWTAPGLDAPWPKLLLPHRLRQARILTWGYDAYLVRKGTTSSNRLIDHSTNLVNDLATDRAEHNASSRSLIFVAHSLGGLICKMAITTSRDSPAPHLKDVFLHVKGVLFMGTPHTGSWMADWAKIPAWGLGVVKSSNRSLLSILQTEDQLLESLQVSFLSMLRDLRDNHQRRIEVTCFFEELPLPVVGKVVSKASATFSDHPLMSIHGNHSDMVKFATIEDNGFKRVAGELVRWELELSNGDMSRHANPREPPEPDIQSLNPAIPAERDELYQLFLASLPKDPVSRDTSRAMQGRLFSELMQWKNHAQGPWNYWLPRYLADGHPVNIRDFDGKTPLHHALLTRFDREAKVRALVEAGADLTMKDFEEQTPLDLARALDEALFTSLLRTWQRSLSTK